MSCLLFCFFKQRTAYEMRMSDWSSDVCSSDLLSADMGAERNRDEAGMYLGPFQMARDQTLLAAIEAGVSAVDAVFTDFRDEAGLMREARAAQALGFTGKMAIHPASVPVIQRSEERRVRKEGSVRLNLGG